MYITKGLLILGIGSIYVLQVQTQEHPSQKRCARGKDFGIFKKL